MRNEDFRQYSKELGWLHVAGAEVWQFFTPADEKSRARVEGFVAHLDLGSKHFEKYLECISDFVMAAKHTSNGLISIPMDANHYTGAAYGYAIANNCKNRLERRGYITKVQAANKKEGLCALYTTAFPDDLLDCRFKWHGKGKPVEVRSGRRLDENGKSIGGQRLSLKRFGPSVKVLEAEVNVLRQSLMLHPLTDQNGREYGGLRRIFNKGSLKKGGRFYGFWQQLPEEDRLKLLMAGEHVCEIDVKGAFLNITAALLGAPSLPFDPYAEIGFVKSCTDPAARKKARELAKLLTSAYISNGGKTSRFPRGKKKRALDGRLRIVSVREKFNLPKAAKASDHYADIEHAFPFLVGSPLDVFDLMHIESEIMKHAMLELAAMSVPSVPVHDCLMCRQSDVAVVVSVLQDAMVKQLGRSIAMDVTFSDGETIQIDGSCYAEEEGADLARRSYPHIDWGVLDDLDLIEDFS